MQCVKTTQTIEEIIKKSRFIAIVTPCLSEQEVAIQLQQMHNVHPNASHIAFAYRIKTAQGLVARFQDAGEPTGTAGKPIYQHLEGKNLINVLVAVIRYFGGIKLGAGGLTRAYGKSAKKVIDAASLNEYIEFTQQVIKLSYPQLQSFEYHLKKLDGEIMTQKFTDQVELTISIPVTHLPKLTKLTLQ